MPNSFQSKHAGYYEAVLQLRPANQEMLELVYRMIKKHPEARITREEDFATGRDLFISNGRVAMAIGKQLKKQFGGALTVSRTLHTFNREKSKRIYRLTILFRTA